jgi:hypothetical protein
MTFINNLKKLFISKNKICVGGNQHANITIGGVEGNVELIPRSYVYNVKFVDTCILNLISCNNDNLGCGIFGLYERNGKFYISVDECTNVIRPKYRDFKQKFEGRKIVYVEKLSFTKHIFEVIFSDSNWVRDLTRECVESNPGPLSSINENKPYVEEHKKGIFIYCYQCDKESVLTTDSCNAVFFTALCDACSKNIMYLQQSDYLSEDAEHDIRNRLFGFKEWLYDGKHHGKSFLEHYICVPSIIKKHLSLLEDVCILSHHLFLSNNTFDRYVAVANFCKLRGSRLSFTTTLGYIVSDLFGSCVNKKDPLYDEICSRMDYKMQSDENPFAEIRSYINMYDKLKETTIYKKLYKFLLYILSMGLLDGVNINFQSLEFEKFEAEAIKRSHKPGVDMVHCMLDTICFICERGLQFFRSGDVQCIFHSGNAYESWISTAHKLLKDSKLLSNPEPHGINKFTFLSELKDAIEKGKSIIKFTAKLDKFERMAVQKVLFDLQLVESNEITRKSAQMPRKDPFAVLVHGSSSICKSQLKQILFYHYGKIFGLPTSPEYMYTRCPTDEYWSGFNSTQWCIVMDDIAFLKPNNEVDPTLKEMLQVKNSVAYTPPQASLEEKGRTPVRSELLIGTTNTKHLNLYAYFACPFAIARRMSYVISATIKPEFSKFNIMADSNKIPITPEGEYMNIWNFEVSIPVPEKDENMDNQQTKYQIIKIFTDINDLLAWYITQAKEHETSQLKALAADNTMMNIELCNNCYRAKKYCNCFIEQSEIDYVKLSDDLSFRFKFQLYILSKIISCSDNYFPYDIFMIYFGNAHYFYALIYANLMFAYTSIYYYVLLILSLMVLCGGCFLYIKFWVILAYICMYWYGSLWKFNLAKKIVSSDLDAIKFIFRLTGERVKQSFTNTSLMALALFCSSVATITVLSKLWNMYKPQFNEQGSVGTVPVAHNNEKPTFYYHDPYVTTEVEISGQSKCAQGDILLNKIKNNTAKFHFKFVNREKIVDRTTAINIKGNIWMFNKHAYKGEAGSLDVIFDPISQNVSRNIKNIAFCKLDVYVPEFGDLAFIELRAIPPGQNLLPYFPKDLLKGRYKGKYIMIDNEGDKSILEINDIYSGLCPVFGIPGYHGKAAVNTVVGTCGSLCLAQVGDAQVILGSHTAGNKTRGVFLQSIYQSTLNEALSKYGAQVDSGVIPVGTDSCTRSVISVNEKSTLRFLETGTAHVMGSFAGFRPKHKSKVVKTFICDLAVAGGYKDDYGAPDMTWRPWHLAIKDMTNPTHTFQNSVLKECEDAFTEDLVVSLGDKINELSVYTQEVALNGAAGVAFVDRINTSTSAGNPYKKSKKFFIKLDENNHIIGLAEEIQRRIDSIIDLYEAGVRFHPQFCGHLKDEATLKRKILAWKTRVFTGGEFAWSVVVRKYFLSHIRLIQNNPFIFEAMPGIVAQSSEWNKLYNYLVKYGKDQIVAGDYGKFDKKMAAPFILSAFNILIRLAEKAGWCEQDLMVLRCISYDTAFPCIDFNGDLIEIQGNPSGHPLTVIINCLVNSLYMRYAFKLISGKSLCEFKKFVNLATYGDDNIMGISKECPNFNHTRIALAMKIIGVEYTMAEKEAESVPYINIDDASFLKRKFVFDKDIGTIVAPLDHCSIDKMLTSCLLGKDLAPEAHSICVIETALREYFFYGKEKFMERRKFFLDLIEKAGLSDWVRESTIPNYNQMIHDFWMRFGDAESASKFSGVSL